MGLHQRFLLLSGGTNAKVFVRRNMRTKSRYLNLKKVLEIKSLYDLSRSHKYSNKCLLTNYYIPLTFYNQTHYSIRQEKVSSDIHTCMRAHIYRIRNYHINPSNQHLLEPPDTQLTNKYSNLYKFNRVHCIVKNSTIGRLCLDESSHSSIWST